MLSRIFIERPKFALGISILILLVGLLALTQLPIESMPDITPPTIAVSASYPGADAATVLESVASPIEEQVNGVENMIYMDSKSDSEGKLNLVVSFDIGTDVDMAQVMTKNRVAVAEPLLPSEVMRQGVKVDKNFSMRLWLDPERMKARGLTAGEVLTAVRA